MEVERSIMIDRGGVLLAGPEGSVVLLPSLGTATVRAVKFVDGYLTVVRWENLVTHIYVFYEGLGKPPEQVIVHPHRPLAVSVHQVSADRMVLSIQDPCTPLAVVECFRGSEDVFFPPQAHHGLAEASSNDRECGIPYQFFGQPDNGKIVLTAYAGFGITQPMDFNPHIARWVADGGQWAQVFARGGGELGKAWHDLGRGPGNMTGAYDVIAVAQELSQEGNLTLHGYGFSHGGTQLLRASWLAPGLLSRVAVWSPALELCRPWAEPWHQSWVDEYGDFTDPQQQVLMTPACPMHAFTTCSAASVVMVLSSEDDLRVPAAQVRCFVQAARRAGHCVDWEHAQRSGHAGTGDRDESDHQVRRMWDFLNGK